MEPKKSMVLYPDLKRKNLDEMLPERGYVEIKTTQIERITVHSDAWSDPLGEASNRLTWLGLILIGLIAGIVVAGGGFMLVMLAGALK